MDLWVNIQLFGLTQKGQYRKEAPVCLYSVYKIINKPTKPFGIGHFIEIVQILQHLNSFFFNNSLTIFL